MTKALGKPQGKPLVTNEHGVGGEEKTFVISIVLNICYIFFLILCQSIPIMTMLPVESESFQNKKTIYDTYYDEYLRKN